MTAGGASTVFERLAALERAMAAGAATECRETPLGTAFLAPDTPDAWDANLLIAGPAARDARALDAHLDELLAGCSHRRVAVYDDAAGAALAPGLVALGYEAERDVVLALDGEPPAAGGAAAEVAREEVRAIERAGLEEDGAGPDLIEQLDRMRDRTARAVPARFFAAEGRAHATVYRMGDLASIVDLGTLAAARGRGLARSLIGLAARTALGDGARDVVLVTDAADWMQGFYRRAGFGREAGATWTFTATGR